jgi:hypothetical protein
MTILETDPGDPLARACASLWRAFKNRKAAVDNTPHGTGLIDLVRHQLITRLGSLMVVLLGLLFAALHYWPPHG